MRLYGKEQPLLRLGSFARSGRFPHALLFTGESGVGRRTMCLYTAMLLLCERNENGINPEPCRDCSSCRKIGENVHPDLLFAMRDGKYKMEDIRAIVTSGSVRPNDGAVKVYIFEDLETMPPPCQNVLLKFIEEPMPFNRFLFTAGSLSGVLETIQSRVTAVDVPAASEGECLAALTSHGIESGRARELIASHGTNIGKCLSAARDTGGVEGLVRAIVAALKNRSEYDTAAAFAKIPDRAALQKLLPMLAGVLRDCILYKNGRDTLTGCDRAGAASLAAVCDTGGLLGAIGLLEEFSAQAQLNPNLSLAAAYYANRVYTELIK